MTRTMIGSLLLATSVPTARLVPGTTGWDLAQGWHLSRPMPIDALLPWLKSRPQVDARSRGALRLV